MRLFTKVILGVGLGAVFIVSIVGYLVFKFTKSALEQTAKEQQLELGKQSLDKIDQLLFGYYLSIQNIGEEEHIERTLGGELTDLRVIKRRIKELPFLTGPWDVLKVVNQHGIILVSSVEEVSGATSESDPDNLTALKEAWAGRVYYSDLILSRETGKPTMIFTAPIRDQENPDQPIVGAILGQISWPVIKQILQNIDTGPGTEFNLYNQEGVLIANNLETRVNILVKDEIIADVIQKNFLTTARPFSITAQDERAQRQELITYIPSQGYLAYTGNRWVLSVETPTVVAYAYAGTTSRNIVLVILPIILGTVGLLLIFVIRFFVRPVVMLTAVSQAITQGDLSKRANIVSKDELGILAKTFNTMTDKLQASHQELSERARFIEALLDNLPVGVSLVEVGGRIVLFNKAGKKIIGRDIDRTKRVGNYLTYYEMTKEDGSPYPPAQEPVNLALKEGKLTTRKDIFITRKDGSKILLHLTASPLLDAKGKVTGAIMVFQDGTEEYMVDRAKTEFVSLASHQLRTPLSSINWYSEMLLSGDAGKITETQREFATEISKSSKRMTELVGMLLNVSRIELGSFAVDPVEEDLRTVLENELDDLKPSLAQKKLRLDVVTEKAPTMLKVDPKLMSIVIQNLLSNAIKYTPDNGKITVKLGKDPKTGNVLVSVIDTGFGIPKESQDKIFSKLYRSDVAKAIDADGNGLGLYMVKSILESTGCQISFISPPPGQNTGTAFYVRIPKEGMKQRAGIKHLGGFIT